MAGVPPKRAEIFYWETELTSQADTKLFQVNPTIAAGDVIVYRDGVLDGNIDTIPTPIGASQTVACQLSVAETTGVSRIKVRFHDAVGAQWCDQSWEFFMVTTPLDELVVAIWAYATRTLTSFGALATNVTTILNRLGAFTGTGVNTVLGFLRAIMRKDVDTPSDVGGTYDDATDSLQAIRDALRSTTINVPAVVDGSVITIVRGDTLVADLDGLGDISNYVKLWFTVKRDRDDADSASILQVLLTNPAAATDGLQYLNAAAATATQGSITVDDATTGDITVTVDEVATAQLADQACVYDIQVLRATGVVNTLTWGECDINADVTRATS
jgi:hypothetical protein